MIGSTVIATSAGGDNCPFIPNPAQTVTCNGNNSANCGSYLAQDTSGNTIGDACNTDIDGDGIANVSDNCPFFANADQSVMPAFEPGSQATLCTGIDTDGDGVPDFRDNCPAIANPDQNDINQNGIGDVCDPDMDGDGIADKALVKDANGNPTGSTPILVNEGSPTRWATTARPSRTTTRSTVHEQRHRRRLQHQLLLRGRPHAALTVPGSQGRVPGQRRCRGEPQHG